MSLEQAAHRTASHGDDGLADLGRGAARRKVVLDVAADHHPDELVRRRLGGHERVHPPPVLQDGDAVRDLEDLGEPMRDEEDADALLDQQPDTLEEGGRLMRRQGGSRLVHDQDSSVDGQRLGDLDGLLLRHREPLDQPARRHPPVDAQLCQELSGGRRHGPAVDDRPAHRLAAEEDVLRDRPLRQEVELLVDDADAGSLGILRVAEAHFLAGHANRSGLGDVRSGEDLHQRRLARAVLAQHRVDLSGAQVEVDLAEHRDAEERLADAAHLEQRRGWLAGNLGDRRRVRHPPPPFSVPRRGALSRPQCRPARRARRAPSPRRP